MKQKQIKFFYSPRIKNRNKPIKPFMKGEMVKVEIKKGNRLLILDPGSSTGYCVIDIRGKKANIFRYGYFDIDTSSNFQGDHCLDLMKKVKKFFRRYRITHVGVEDYFFVRSKRNGSTVNVAFRTAIHIACRQHNLPYTIINISAWKKFITKGRCTPTKEQKKKWGNLPAKKLFIQQALWEIYKFKFPNHSLSKKTNKPIVFRTDIVDVVAMGVYMCFFVFHIQDKDIKMTVKPPKDVDFKKTSKKMFVYK